MLSIGQTALLLSKIASILLALCVHCHIASLSSIVVFFLLAPVLTAPSHCALDTIVFRFLVLRVLRWQLPCCIARLTFMLYNSY